MPLRFQFGSDWRRSQPLGVMLPIGNLMKAPGIRGGRFWRYRVLESGSPGGPIELLAVAGAAVAGQGDSNRATTIKYSGKGKLIFMTLPCF